MLDQLIEADRTRSLDIPVLYVGDLLENALICNFNFIFINIMSVLPPQHKKRLSFVMEVDYAIQKTEEIHKYMKIQEKKEDVNIYP